ncbi:lytic transglycosylase domain-containing protein [Entomobacter blattae]|uniref:Transglycosylase SLT domain protein n=1 Tax=Entomobacter blattae TaxID=2762277 RepID=A0A7H1NQQ1_9PROT|nr:lytic transglycosylase domain-containing protein [Entomobacter blattae]QNT78111.1 Transglycosylase SLT domain protein [Entomobacter blattae]
MPFIKSSFAPFFAPWPLFLRLAFCCLFALGLAACGGDSARVGSSRFSNAPPDGTNPYPPPGPPNDPWGPYIQEASSRMSIPHQWIRAVIKQESGGYQYMDGSPITSSAGAMGLMQLMAPTYADMQEQYGLGDDAYEPHDNIMAGTAYIRRLYKKYGAPAFLAAYNAGPARLERYLYQSQQLPNETVNYVASITPNLGNDLPLSGPLASYAGPDQTVSNDSQGSGTALPPVSSGRRYARTAQARTQTAYNTASTSSYYRAITAASASSSSGGCYHDPNKAFDPARCDPYPVTTPTTQAANCYHDPNKAFDPSRCDPRPAPPIQLASYQQPYPPNTSPSRGIRSSRTCYRSHKSDDDAPDNDASDDNSPCENPPLLVGSTARAVKTNPLPSSSSSQWASYTPPANPLSQKPSAMRRTSSPTLPTYSALTQTPVPYSHGEWGIQVGAYTSQKLALSYTTKAQHTAMAALQQARKTVQPVPGKPLYRARLTGISRTNAAAACSTLKQSGQPCMILRPGD